MLTTLALTVLRVQCLAQTPSSWCPRLADSDLDLESNLIQTLQPRQLTNHKCPHPELVANMAQRKLMIQDLRLWHSEAFVLRQRLPRTGHCPSYSSEEFKNFRSPAESVRFFQINNDLAAEFPCSAVVSTTYKKWDWVGLCLFSGTILAATLQMVVAQLELDSAIQPTAPNVALFNGMEWNSLCHGVRRTLKKHLYRQYNHVQALWHVL